MSNILHNERLDDAAKTALSHFAWAALAGLGPALFTRRLKVLVVSQAFAMGVASGLTWRDTGHILRAPRHSEVAVEVPAKD